MNAEELHRVQLVLFKPAEGWRKSNRGTLQPRAVTGLADIETQVLYM